MSQSVTLRQCRLRLGKDGGFGMRSRQPNDNWLCHLRPTAGCTVLETLTWVRNTVAQPPVLAKGKDGKSFPLQNRR